MQNFTLSRLDMMGVVATVWCQRMGFADATAKGEAQFAQRARC
jgi:hypothetical protein